MLVNIEKFKLALLNSPEPEKKLIKRAGVSSTVWRNAKNGKSIFPYSACRIAMALGIEPVEFALHEPDDQGD